MFVFKSRGILPVCLLYDELSVILDHLLKGLRDVHSIPSYVGRDNANGPFPLMDWLGSP